MQYELINPSDPYTFIAKNKEVAALTVFLISTMYGARSETGEEEVPVFLIGNPESWYQSEFHRPTDEGFLLNKKEVAKALESFMLGNFEDRQRYEIALNAITDPVKKEEFIAAWQEGRSSLNNIGTYAHALSKKLQLELES